MTENNIIRKENIDPFKNKILKDGLNITSFIKSLQTIPKIYFEIGKNTNSIGVGNDIINSYNNIKTNIKKMDIIKNFILSILKTSLSELKNISIQKKYQLKKNNLIINIENNLNKAFNDQESFNEFLNNYKKENYNIFKNTISENDTPYFYNIFQSEYLGKNKNFFLDLFKEYIEIRKNIIPHIKKNNGIIGFDMIFEINDNINLDKIKNTEKTILKEGNNNINYNEYILSGENIMTNSKNNNNVPKKKSKSPNLQPKIHKSNLLYIEKYESDHYINLHSTKLKDIYSIITNKVKSLANSESNNLYDITVNLIELDFNVIKFIFNYIDQDIFNNFIKSHIKIKRYIYEKINTFDIYYEPYIQWYNKTFSLSSESITKNSNRDEIENFTTIFDKMMKEMDKKSENVTPKNNTAENLISGVNISVPIK